MKTTISNAQLTASINHKGAELISLAGPDQEYIWEGNPDFWGKHSPVLFPIVGALKGNSYRFGGRKYELSRHGFARDMEFEVAEQSAQSVTFSLKSDENTLKLFPFAFELQLIYTLEKNRLELTYKVINKETSAIYFSIGAHPAFALPGDFTDYNIEMQSDETLQYHLLENDLLSEKTGEIILKNRRFPLNHSLFENDALVFKRPESASLTILKGDDPLVKVDFKGFPSLGIWTKTDAPFLCIEPWFGYSDTARASGNLTEKEGIVTLGGNSQFDAKFSIEVF